MLGVIHCIRKGTNVVNASLIGGSIGTVKLAQWTPKDDPKKYGYTKGELMNVHKSTVKFVEC